MTESLTSAGPPPGWYADSPRASRLRWWTGSEWTSHYRDVNEPQPGEPTQPLVNETPKSRAERRATLAAAEAHPLLKNVSEPEPEPEPGQGPVPGSPTPAAKPDMIVDRSLRTANDRMPQPVVHRPTSAIPVHAGSLRSTFVPVSRNRYATWSIALSIFGAAGFGLATFWLTDSAPQISNVVTIVSLGSISVAVVLAVVAVVVAGRRPTRKGWAVAALVVAVVACASMVFALTDAGPAAARVIGLDEQRQVRAS